MPKNWRTYKLKEVAKLSTGFAFKSKLYENEGNLRVIRGKNVTEGYLRWGDDAKHWNHSLDKLQKYLILENDIVIGMDGSKIGKNRALVRKLDLPAILAQRVARVQVKPELASQKLIWQLINNSPFENYVENVKTGTSIPHISLGQVGDFEITLPPLPEQKAIASILSALDDKIENNLAMNKTLEDMAMALYKHWFVDFVPFQEGRFIDSELGLIPEGWEVKLIKEVADVNSRSIKKGTAPKRITYIDIASANIGWVSEVESMHFSDAPSRARRIIDDGDIVWSTVRPNRKSRFLSLDFEKDTIVSTGFAVISPKVVPYSYLYPHCCTDDFTDYLVSRATGSSYPAVTGKIFEQALIILPSKLILSAYDKLTKPYYQRFASNNVENKTLTNLRDTLLPKLISGEVRLKEFEKEITAAL